MMIIWQQLTILGHSVNIHITQLLFLFRSALLFRWFFFSVHFCCVYSLFRFFSFVLVATVFSRWLQLDIRQNLNERVKPCFYTVSYAYAVMLVYRRQLKSLPQNVRVLNYKSSLHAWCCQSMVMSRNILPMATHRNNRLISFFVHKFGRVHGSVWL